MTTRFVLLRHGEAEGNREPRYLGASDVALTPRG
ncbi:MAG: histidine phosphatase family protein [Ktedonobacterales bacterium]|nr:histidine phosphatase family protein [Ktedonobacterales bacterium]